MVRGEAVQRGANADRKIKRPSWELNQTVNTVYFILGISRTDLWSQGILWQKSEVEVENTRY